jgi:hypothetical protein
MNTKTIKVSKKNSECNNEINEKINKNNDILEKIMDISSKIYNDQCMILSKLNSLEEKVMSIEKKMELSLNSKLLNNFPIDSLKELKKEDLVIDKKDILKALSYRDYRSIIFIFRLYYKNKTNSLFAYPIKITGKRSFEYYLNSVWNPDLYGYHSMNTICLNIQNLFIQNNTLDGSIGHEDFILNQEFIYKLSDEKYKRDVFKNIVEEVRINNA